MSRKNSPDIHRKGLNSFRREDDTDKDHVTRDRSPLRSDERNEDKSYAHQNDSSKQKFGFGIGKRPVDQKKGIQIKLGALPKQSSRVATLQRPSVASVFDPDEDEEPEEMPAEARMRMRNIGRETPTSAGPNSFGKTKQGFCDSKKIFEKTLKKAMDEANN